MSDGDGGLAAIEPVAAGYVEPVVDLGECRGEGPVADGDDAVGAHEPLTDAEAWAAFGTRVYCHVLEPARQAANEALGDLADAVHDGRRPTAAQVRGARRALDEARDLVETHYAALAPGVDPWVDGVGGRVPYRALREQLEAAGYTVTRDDR